MIQYAKLVNNVVVAFPVDIRKLSPQTSLPDTIPDWLAKSLGFHPILIVDQPEDTATTTWDQDTIPSEVEGVWQLGWTERAKTSEELQDAIRAERDRRLPLDFKFRGKYYQRDPVSVARISGAGILALGAMGQGAQVGDYYWHGGTDPFTWIASDDTLTLMDAQTCFAFGSEAAAQETRLIFTAKALQAMDPVPSNFTDDSWWHPPG